MLICAKHSSKTLQSFEMKLQKDIESFMKGAQKGSQSVAGHHVASFFAGEK